MNAIQDALSALRDEERQLATQLSKVRQAITLLSDAGGASRQARTQKRSVQTAEAKSPAKAATGVRNRRPMTAAQKKAVSIRMKKYWAARKRASR